MRGRIAIRIPDLGPGQGPDDKLNRVAVETFTVLYLTLPWPQFPLESKNERRNTDAQLHIRQVSSNASSGSLAERLNIIVEVSAFLVREVRVVWLPPLWLPSAGIPEELVVPMECIHRRGNANPSSYFVAGNDGWLSCPTGKTGSDRSENTE